MAWSGHCGQHHTAEADLLTVVDNSADRRRREGLHRPRLWVVGADHAASDDARGRRGSHDSRATELLEPCDPAGVVGVLVTHQNDSDVADPEAQLPDIVGDEVRGGFGPAVDKNAALIADDQN